MLRFVLSLDFCDGYSSFSDLLLLFLFLFHSWNVLCTKFKNNFGKWKENKNIKGILQHFVCAVCEKPFLGHRHYEKKGLAYCEQHYHKVSFSTAQ